MFLFCGKAPSLRIEMMSQKKIMSQISDVIDVQGENYLYYYVYSLLVKLFMFLFCGGPPSLRIEISRQKVCS